MWRFWRGADKGQGRIGCSSSLAAGKRSNMSSARREGASERPAVGLLSRKLHLKPPEEAEKLGRQIRNFTNGESPAGKRNGSSLSISVGLLQAEGLW